VSYPEDSPEYLRAARELARERRQASIADLVRAMHSAETPAERRLARLTLGLRLERDAEESKRARRIANLNLNTKGRAGFTAS
jgi:hypothetical protein